MRDILNGLFHAGIGLTKLKKEDIDRVFSELKKRGEVEEEDRELFITRTLDKLEKTGKDVTEKILNAINPNLEKLNELNAKVDELIKEIDTLKKKKA
jgi:polyhydroxyalkanoate synthesis regulator phasin